MAKVTRNGTVLAESDEAVALEGNLYFPPGSVAREHLAENEMTTQCPWKGEASYYDVELDGTTLPAVAWYYPDPSEAASEITDHVAFYRCCGIEITP
jgi:uncharacterized protein (DUF427 family)